MHHLVYTGQVSWRLNDKIFSRVDVLYNLKSSIVQMVLQKVYSPKLDCKII